MIDGIGHPRTYYYRTLFTDAVRETDAPAMHSRRDSSWITMSGRSQGGGVALAAAASEPHVVVSVPDVPF